MRIMLLFCLFIYQAIFTCCFAQVNLQTGASQFSIPLYGYQNAANRITHDISLTFMNGSGLKVSEIASQVGTGWNLQMGGVISRRQNGEADDQKQYNDYGTSGTNYANNYYPNGYLNRVYFNSINDGLSITPLYISPNVNWLPHPRYLEDRERDVFEFSFANRTGEFVITSGTSAGSAMTLELSKLKIERVETDMISNGIRTRIAEFHITDEQGIKYIFKDIELAEALKYDDIRNYNNPNNLMIYSSVPVYNSGVGSLTLGRALGQYVAERWYLTEIVNPLTNKKVTFEYESYDLDLHGDRYYQKESSGSTATFALRLIRTKGKCKRIKTIYSSANEKVEFVYSSAFRVDVPTDKYLEKIKVSYNNELRYQWEFTMGYFLRNEVKPINYSFSEGERPFARLCLISIQKKGANGEAENPYQFSYYLGDAGVTGDHIPANFSYYHDHFGYSNATLDIWPYYTNETNTNTYTIANSNIVHVLPINNPTTYRQVKPGLAKNGILQTVKLPAGGEITFEYEQNNVKEFNGTTVYTGGVRVNKVKVFDGENHGKDIITEYKYELPDGSTSGWGYNDPVYTLNFPTSISTCDDDHAFAGISYHQVVGALFNATTSNMHRILIGAINPSQALGQIVGGAVLAMAFNVFIKAIIDAFNDDTFTTITSSTSSDPVNYGNPLPLNYSRVQITESMNGVTSGKIIYSFTSDVDNPVLVPTLYFPFSGRQRSADWLYGLPKEISFYNSSNVLVKKTVNHYSYLANPFFGWENQKWGAHNRDYVCYINMPSGPTSTINVTADVYNPVTGKTELTQTDEYTYDALGNYAMHSTNFEYSPLNYLVQRISTRNSKNEPTDKFIFYPADYSQVAGPMQMVSNNIYNVPVGTQTFCENVMWGRGLMYGSVLEFGIAPNGDFKPQKTYTYSNPIPVDEGQVEFNSAQLYPTTGPWYKLTSTVSYNNKGVPVNTTAEQGKSCQIFDYDNHYQVAEISNANINEVAYCSFESDGYGEWQFTSGYAILENGMTGRKSFKGTLTKNLLPAGDYMVTLWSLVSGNATVNGVSGTTLVIRGNWKLLQWKLTNVTNVEVTGDQIDEVRLHPPGAQMKTMTFDPLVGKTSECDVANRVVYYLYDGLGRLRTVMDESRNVIKSYQYNYKQ